MRIKFKDGGEFVLEPRFTNDLLSVYVQLGNANTHFSTELGYDDILKLKNEVEYIMSIIREIEENGKYERDTTQKS